MVVRMETMSISEVLGKQHVENWILLCFKYQQSLIKWTVTKIHEKHMPLLTCKLSCGYYQENLEQI